MNYIKSLIYELVKSKRHLRESIFLLLVVLCGVILLFKPQGGVSKKHVQTQGIDMVFVLDVSKSMQVHDVEVDDMLYSRIDAAKMMIQAFLAQRAGDRVGLVVFAQDATSICPLTDDYSVFLTFLAGVNRQNVNQQGTDLSNAVGLGIQRLQSSEDDEERGKALILISDGGENEEDYSVFEESFDENPVAIVTVGVGTEQGGKIAEGRDPFGNLAYKIYDGKYVTSALNDTELRNISKKFNGDYVQLKSLAVAEEIQGVVKGLKSSMMQKVQINEKQDLTRHVVVLMGLFLFGFMGLVIWGRWK